MKKVAALVALSLLMAG
ncbi:hypothetical protein, partial [Escherichia coli]